ncbi:MAG: 2-C-methyl-D-erythritol 4-phosphate cytidylyltransferase [Planctomycetes bacterium]|nr:2-C-methyl-D-erythritol 4-phosphate cytidylyltransferase [Planctomycetota bacterium]
MPRWSLLIPAAGSGRRMGGKKKPLLRLDGKPLIVHALAAFRGIADVVIAVPPGEVERWKRRLHVKARFVEGGARRQDSVANALAAAVEATHVLVHDAARPFPGKETVRRVMEATLRTGAAIPGLAVADTLKRVKGGLVSETVSREGLWRVQTPQGVRADWLREAFARAAREKWDVTDEAMLLEKCGRPVAVVEGDPRNVKVTTAADWKLLQGRGGG